LEGRELREIVHYANPKDPEGRLRFSDGQIIELPFGSIEVVTSGAVRVSMERSGDSSYHVTYTGAKLTIAELWIRFGTGPWAEEASREIDEWVGGGFSDGLHMVVDTRMALAAD
jgi:hypothetical protein